MGVRGHSTPLLDSGVVSRTARRNTFLTIFLIALIWRAGPVIHVLRAARGELQVALDSAVPVPFTLQDFSLGLFVTSPEVAWVGSPLFSAALAAEASAHSGGTLLLALQWLLSALLAAMTYHAGERWVGHRAATLAALLCAINKEAVAATLAVVPATAIALVALAFASRLSRIHTRSETRDAFRLGLGTGTLTLLSGLGVWWAISGLIWLPLRGRPFRGWRWAAAAGYFLAGHVAVVSPVLFHNALTQHDLVLPTAHVPFELYQGAVNPAVGPQDDLAQASDLVARRQYAQLLLQRLDPGHRHRELGAGMTWLRLAAGHSLQHPGQVVSTQVRRGLAYLGGALPAATSGWLPSSAWQPTRLPLLPLWVILAVGWLGFAALLGSLRAYLPLYTGLLLPFAAALLSGATLGCQVVALPFVCLCAGYGAVRVWEGRSWVQTWVIALPLLALGGLTVWLF